MKLVINQEAGVKDEQNGGSGTTPPIRMKTCGSSRVGNNMSSSHDEDDLTSHASDLDLRISTENISRISELGIVGGQEVDESDYDSRFLSVSNRTATTNGTTLSGSIQHASLTHHNEHSDDYDENHHLRDSPTGSVGGGGRIQFSTHKLYGRDKQLQLLHQYYNDQWKTSSSSPPSHLKVVHVTGYSGSGKTRLVNEFIQQLKQKQKQQRQQKQPQVSSSSTMSYDSLQQATTPLYIMHGKYEEPSTADSSTTPIPYKGISDALNGWYSSLTEKEKVSISSYMQKHFLNIVGRDDLSVLIDIVPSLKRLLVNPSTKGGDDKNKNEKGFDNTLTSYNSAINADDPMNKTRLHFVFQSFIKCLCQRGEAANETESSMASILFYFDNMHWADLYSLDILRSILSEPTSCNSMVILTTRSNEIEGNDDHPLKKRLLHPIKKVRRKEEEEEGDNDEGECGIHTMKVKNLTQPYIGEFIADSLLLKRKDVEPLSTAIYKRTLGNIFFTMQAMEQLYRQNFLYYDLVSFQWRWVQLSKEEFEDHLSEDIVEMVRSKIKCLSIDAQRVLSVFSHTRSTLDADTLLELFNATSSADRQVTSGKNGKIDNNNASYDKSELLKLLNEAVEEGLLTTNTRMVSNKSINSNRSIVEYSFVHDRIREAARSFWVEDTLYGNLFLIGNALVLRGSNYHVGEDWMLITAVQHLNSIPPRFHDAQGKLSLARLNLETAKLSMGRAALEDAAKYAEKGIQYLPQNRWDAHGALSHELYALAAESSRLVGHLTQMERYCTTCLTAEKDRPQATKCDIYFTFASGLLYGTQRFKAAKEIVLDVLNNLGCPFPRSAIGAKAKALSSLTRLIMTKRKRTIDHVGKMHFMTDEIAIKTMKFLDLLFGICYLMNDELLTPLIMFKALEYTLNYGVSIFSPRLISSVCVIFTGPLNNLRDGEKHALYSLQLMKKVNHKPIEAGTVMGAYIFGLHWSTPAIDCIPPLRQAYEVGMNTGQVESACWCMSLILLFLFQSGTPLPAVDAQMRANIPKMEETGHKTIALATSAIWKAVLGVLGAPDPINFSTAEVSKNPTLKCTISAYRRAMLAYLGEYEQCADSTVGDKNRPIKVLPGSPTVPFEMFLSALSCFEMARKNPGKPDYLKAAKRARKWIVSWAKQGSPNLQHRRALLDAELAAIQRQDKKALEKFELAVDLALKGKFQNDAAVANERWGTFALEVLDNEAEGRSRLNDALALSMKWGAVGKIQRLKDRFPEMFPRQQHPK